MALVAPNGRSIGYPTPRKLPGARADGVVADLEHVPRAAAWCIGGPPGREEYSLFPSNFTPVTLAGNC